jgi:hypothetical protein
MAIRPFGNGQKIGLSTDTKPTLPKGWRFYEEDTGDTLYSDGTYWWLASPGPFTSRKWGRGPMGGSVQNGSDLTISMSAYTGAGSQSMSTSNTSAGKHVRYRTSTTTGNRGGVRSAMEMSLRDWNPRIRIRFALVHTTNVRYYMGFAPAAELTGDDPLNALDGFMIGYIAATSANYIIMHNDGTGATTTVSTGVAAVGSAVHDAKLVYDNANSRISWSFDGGAYNHITTDIPRTAQVQNLHMAVETAEGALKDLQVFDLSVQSDK